MNDTTRPAGDRRHRILLSVLVISAASAAAWGANAPPSSTKKQPFYQESDAAMATMMKDMDAAPSGNVDRDFATMMIPHHQGAIDMARSELRYGHNEQLRRIAQEIVVDQAQEIVVMRAQLELEPARTAALASDPVDAAPATTAICRARRTL